MLFIRTKHVNFGGNPLHQATKTTLKQQLNGEKYSHVVFCPNKQRYFEPFMRLDLKYAKSFVLINSVVLLLLLLF